jgi:hypothetical protein
LACKYAANRSLSACVSRSSHSRLQEISEVWRPIDIFTIRPSLRGMRDVTSSEMERTVGADGCVFCTSVLYEPASV